MSFFLDELSAVQREAVVHYQGPALIIAGAGSGKTRVLTYRIAYTLQQGVPPHTILALTFTNKAAQEMKERIGTLIGTDTARSLWMGTFHSIFARILRREAEHLGYPSSFSIYDTADTKSLLKACIKELQLDEEKYKVSAVASRISMAKNNLIRPGEYAENPQIQETDKQCRRPNLYEIYRLYARKCKQAGAMDFDDLLLNTNVLFRNFPDVLARYRNLFQYILVDEYQDTNYAQYIIIKRLSQGLRNLCVVGDDAQSIYAFRGARIENILNFRNDYPDFREYRLEENYRSTQTIVNAANDLIEKNSRQLKKKCFSSGRPGEKIGVIRAYTDQEESFLVASSVAETVYRHRSPYSEFAVLYRTNAQSRVFEEAFRKKNIPYIVYGGLSFYQRAEVKDMLAYLRLIVNPHDDEAFKRAVQTPSRGIGDTSIGHLQIAAGKLEKSLHETLQTLPPADIGLRTPAATKLKAFCAMIAELSSLQFALNAYELAEEVDKRSGYRTALKNEGTIEASKRLENVDELFNSILEFCNNPNNADPDGENQPVILRKYLEEAALRTDMDNEKEEDRNKVRLMTIHSAKGLEFSYVYIAGMEDGLFPYCKEDKLFPGVFSICEEDLEEERRLLYVAITRAKIKATVSLTKMRYRHGQQAFYKPSRFLKEIDDAYFKKSTLPDDKPAGIYGTDTPAFPSFGRGRATNTGTPARRPMPPSAQRTFTPDHPANLAVGMTIEHDRFGIGVIVDIEGAMPHTKAIVDFEDAGRRTLLLQYATLRRVER
ncbi:MAG: UvrD-helicase domain-containing protein [Prevotellaceae bacterium]|jgi:DNA helicase-2/ATP-dependent DNA helicase PcrA|nr:UvrD-helicase domain-containing protein [Prevotellaceae bacterium]